MIVFNSETLYEVPGAYGAIGFRERLLQMIWNDPSLWSQELKTYSGKRLRILQTGRWNHQEGPDFLQADVEIEGVGYFGDIELHFRAKDWLEHGHHQDERYRNVVLHVLLFDPKPGEFLARRCDGYEPETLVLGPYLKMDLEAIAELEAELFATPDLPHALSELSASQLCHHLRRQAQQRWQGKVAMAQIRLARLPWTDYLHSGFLETLGAMRNRTAMLQIAGKIPYATFAGCTMTQLKEAGGIWRLNGLRPSARPEPLLHAYQRFCRLYPDWPEQLRIDSGRLNKRWRSGWRTALAAAGLSLARWDTFVVNHLLPALASGEQDVGQVYAIWFRWPAGTMPDYCARWVRTYLPADIVPSRICNGWQQAALHCTRNQNPFR